VFSEGKKTWEIKEQTDKKGIKGGATTGTWKKKTQEQKKVLEKLVAGSPTSKGEK